MFIKKSKINKNELLEFAISSDVDYFCLDKLLKNDFNINSFSGYMLSSVDSHDIIVPFNPAIFMAVSTLKKDMVDMVLKHKPDLSVCDNRNTPILIYLIQKFILHEKVNSEVVSIFSSLIEKGANSNDRDIRGYQPLHSICEIYKGSGLHNVNSKKMNLKYYKQMFDILLENNVDINSRNASGETPLVVATKCNNVNAIKILIEKGADWSIINKDGMHAIHWSAILKCKDSLEFFIDNGMDMSIICNLGHTIFFYMLVMDGVELSKDPDKRSEINFSVYEKLLKNYPDLISHKDKNGATIFNQLNNMKNCKEKEIFLNLFNKYKK